MPRSPAPDRTCRAALVAAVLAAGALSAPCPAEAQPTRPAAAGEPVRVHVTLVILSVDDIDSMAQTFTANLYIEASWDDPSAAANGAPAIRPLGELWHPRLQLINQRYVMKTLPDEAQITEAGRIIYRQRYWGVFSQPMGFRRYPFDGQSLTVQLVASGYQPEEVQIIASPPPPEGQSMILHGRVPPDWTLVDFHIGSGRAALAPNAPGTSMLKAVVEVKRKWRRFLLTLILPLCLIVAMSWAVFWIDPSKIDANVTVAVTSVLTIIAYRFSSAQALAKIPDATRLDTFVGVATVMVFLAVVQTVYSASLIRQDRRDEARRVERISRFAFPAVFVVFGVWALLFA